MTQAPDDETSEEALDLMKTLVSLIDEKWLTAHRFLQVADRCGIHQIQARIALIAGLKRMAQTLPVGVFPDPKARERLLDAAQEALDLSIDEEDAQD